MSKKKILLIISGLVAIIAIGIIVIVVFLLPNGSIDRPYQISNKADLIGFANKINNGNDEYVDKYLVLTADINLDGAEWVPIGITNTFRGNFDGKGHSISNYVISRAYSDCGFFATMTNNNSVVKNLSLKQAVVSIGSGSINNLGGLVGSSNIRIENCKVEVEYDLTQGADVVNWGGVVGYTANDIVASSFVGSINWSVDEFGDGEDAWISIGGIVGYQANGLIKDCSVNGRIEVASINGNTLSKNTINYGGIAGVAKRIVNCTNAGQITTIGTVGGIAASAIWANEIYIENCINKASITTKSEHSYNVGGLVGAAFGGGTIKTSKNEGAVSFVSLANRNNTNQSVAIRYQVFAGGILGSGNIHVFASANYGNILGYGYGHLYVGGISADNLVTSNCINYGDISVRSTHCSVFAGGIVAVLNEGGNVINNINLGTLEVLNGWGGTAFTNKIAGNIIGFNLSIDNLIKNNYYDSLLSSSFQQASGFDKAVYWYGEESQAENIAGENIENNIGIPTGELSNANNLPSFLEYIDDSRIGEGHVWIFGNTYPKLYFEIEI